MQLAEIEGSEPLFAAPSRPISIVVVVGPTGVGKTDLAIQLAKRLGGEIVSADSRLFYRGMDIGTAKPSLEERRLVPHHLIDVTDPDHPWSLSLFQEQARLAIQAIYERGRLPFLVGGTGQYVRAVIEGWQPPKIAPDPKLRLALEDWAKEIGIYGLHNRLAVLDPAAAAAIDPRNLRRTIRALEVILSSGMPFSAQKRKGNSIYHVLQVGLIRPRQELYAIVDERIRRMLASGWLAEVQELLGKGYPPELPSFSAIGYREVIAYLKGEISLLEAELRIRKATRIYIRRQTNWFKPTDPEIHWYSVTAETVDIVERDISSWLTKSVSTVP